MNVDIMVRLLVGDIDSVRLVNISVTIESFGLTLENFWSVIDTWVSESTKHPDDTRFVVG